METPTETESPRRKNTPRQVIDYELLCLFCGGLFLPRRRDQKYCSSVHARKASMLNSLRRRQAYYRNAKPRAIEGERACAFCETRIDRLRYCTKEEGLWNGQIRHLLSVRAKLREQFGVTEDEAAALDAGG